MPMPSWIIHHKLYSRSMRSNHLSIALVVITTLVSAQDASEWFGKGLNAFNNKNYGEAAVNFTRAIEQDSGATPAWFNRASAYLRIGMYDKAKSDLDFLLRLEPNAVNALMQRSIVLANLGQRQEALRDVTRVIERDSTFPRARLMRGRLILGMGGDTAEACLDLKAAFRLGDSTALHFMPPVCGQIK